MWRHFSRPAVIVLCLTMAVIAVLYISYRWVDPLPPRRFATAAGPAGSGYGQFARQYARILAGNRVELEIRDSADGVQNLEVLRDAASGVQAALTGFGCARPNDPDTLSSLGGIFDAPLYI